MDAVLDEFVLTGSRFLKIMSEFLGFCLAYTICWNVVSFMRFDFSCNVFS